MCLQAVFNTVWCLLSICNFASLRNFLQYPVVFLRPDFPHFFKANKNICENMKHKDGIIIVNCLFTVSSSLLSNPQPSG